MKNMKKYVIIGSVVALILAMVLSPFLQGNQNPSAEDAPMPATFSFKEKTLRN